MDTSAVLTMVQTFLQVLDSPISRDIESVWGYKSQLEKLRDTMSTIKAVFLDAEKLQKHQLLSNTLKNRLQRLQEAVYRADDLFDEVATITQSKRLMSGNSVCREVRLFFSRFNAFKMSCEIREIREILDYIKDDHHSIAGSFQEFDMERRNYSRETHSFVCEEDVIVGRDEDRRIVMDMLAEDAATDGEAVSVTSIVGMGGLGKTSLAQLVYNDACIQKEFQLKMWVCVSDDFNVKLLLSKILAEATNETNNIGLSMDRLQMKIRQVLEGRKYLLVLDDVWNEDSNKWHELRKLLIQCGRGSRIIVTTRSMRVANVVRGHHSHELKGLSDLDSWKLFERMTLNPGQVELEGHLVEIGKVIVSKCANVPLAIRVIGSLLRGQGENAWQNLKHTDLANIEQDENCGIIPVLKISYRYLPSHLKCCFTYCAVFPKDYEINKDDLIYLWMAQGFINNEDLGNDYFMNLLQRCFFHDVKRDDTSGVIVSCKMHDLIHDLAKDVAGVELKSSSYDTSSSSDKTRHIFIDDQIFWIENVESYLTKMKRLRTCLGLRSNIISPYGWLPKMKYLRVLDFSRDGRGLKSYMKKLPRMIGQLVHLRYLDLSNNTKLSTLPNSVTELFNLQTLKLRWCYSLKELPRELSKLVNLRHLDIRDCDKLKHMPPGMNKMIGLHKLTMFVVGGINKNVTCSSSVDIGGKLGDLKYLNNLTGEVEIRIKEGWTYDAADAKEGGYMINKSLLNEIKISFTAADENAEALLEGLQPHPNVKKLRLHHYSRVKFPSWGGGDSIIIMNLSSPLPNLVEVDLNNCTRLKHVPLLSQLRHLKVLQLTELRELVYVESRDRNRATTLSGKTSQGCSHESVSSLLFFPSLERLELLSMPKLKGWCEATPHSMESEIQILGFPSLSKLIISRCPNLTTFPSLPKLETLGIVESSEVLRYFDSLPRESFQHLSSLSIYKDDEIERLLTMEVFRTGQLSSLRSLAFRGCSKLKSITGRRVWEHFSALEILKLVDLPNMEVEDNEGDDDPDTDDDDNDDMPWRCLATSLHTLKLANLPMMWKLSMGMQHLTALQFLSILDLVNLEEIPRWISCLTSLQQLEICGCPKVKSLPEEMCHLTSLNQLSLFGCSAELKERCQEVIGADWHIIQHIPSILYERDLL